MIEEMKNLVYTILQDEETYIRVTTTLYGQPLYAWYCLLIEKFQEGQIEGTLLTCPVNLVGPYDDRETAEQVARSYMNGSPMNGEQG